MNSWRTGLLILLALLIAVILYPRVGVTSHRGAAAHEKREVTLWMPVSGTESLQTAVDEFERENPDTHVIIGAATTRDATSDPTRFLLGIAGGSPPDLIYFDRYAVVEWASRGAFHSLNGYLEGDRNDPDGIHSENYYRPMWEEPSYQGQQYAIPISVDIRALFLNDDLLVRAGFVNPNGSIRPPRTWEDICRKKFDGHGVISNDHVRLGDPMILPGVGPFPTAPDAPRPNDVITLCSGQSVFRARIAEVAPDGGITLDFAREQHPGTTHIPAGIAGDPQCEIKIFDGDSYAIRMTRFNDRGDLSVLGFSPLEGNSWLYMYGWQNGATFMSPDGKTCELDQPAVKVALQFIVDCYDALGGYKAVSAYEGAQQGSPIDPFLNSKVAMRIDGDWFLGTIAALKPDLRFSLVPAPIPAARLARGFKPITWAGGWAYAIPSTAKNPDAAWRLLRFLVSARGIKLQTEVNVSRARGQGDIYFPQLHADQRIMKWLQGTYIKDNPNISDRLTTAYDTFVNLLPDSKYRPVTPVGQKLWQSQMLAEDFAVNHSESVHEALTFRTRQVQQSLDESLHPPTGPAVNWYGIIAAYVTAIALSFGALAFREIRRRRSGRGRRDWIAGFTCVSPWLVGFIIVGGGPILFSFIISFCHYDVLHPAQFIGFQNYVRLLGFHTDTHTHVVVANDPDFWLSLANTAFMAIGLPVGIVAGLLLAMLLNYSFRGIAIFRTIYYLPSVVPAVASFLLWMWIFDPSRGLLNITLRGIGVAEPPTWLKDAAWSKPALIIMGLWGVGGGMLIWLAGLKSIPLQLYEAAEIDGAGAVRRFFNITLPMLSPYIFFNTVMGLIGSLQVFEAAFIMTNGGPANSTLFFAYKLFNEAFRYLDMGAASAMAWIMFAIVLALTLFQLWLSKRWVHYE